MRNSNSQWKNNICEWQQRDKCKFGGVYPFFECMPVSCGPSVNHPARYERVFSLPRPIPKFIIIIIIIMSQCVQFVTFLGNVSGFFLGRVLLYLHLNKELTQIYAINRCKMKFENKTRTIFRYFSYSRPHTHTQTWTHIVNTQTAVAQKAPPFDWASRTKNYAHWINWKWVFPHFPRLTINNNKIRYWHFNYILV